MALRADQSETAHGEIVKWRPFLDLSPRRRGSTKGPENICQQPVSPVPSVYSPAASALNFRLAGWMMAAMITLILTGLLRGLRTRSALVLENLAVRHQLAVLQRTGEAHACGLPTGKSATANSKRPGPAAPPSANRRVNEPRWVHSGHDWESSSR